MFVFVCLTIIKKKEATNLKGSGVMAGVGSRNGRLGSDMNII